MFNRSYAKWLLEGDPNLQRDPEILVEIIKNLKDAHRAKELAFEQIVEAYEMRVKAYEDTIKTLNETIEIMKEHGRS